MAKLTQAQRKEIIAFMVLEYNGMDLVLDKISLRIMGERLICCIDRLEKVN